MAYDFSREPTAEERQKLFDLIYRYETIDFAESQSFTTRDCYGVVEAILEAGFRLVKVDDTPEQETPEPVQESKPTLEPIIERRVDELDGGKDRATDADPESSGWAVVEDDSDVEDLDLEYAVANFGDLEDILEQDGVDRSTRSWAQYMLQPRYGDLLVARPYRSEAREG